MFVGNIQDMMVWKTPGKISGKGGNILYFYRGLFSKNVLMQGRKKKKKQDLRLKVLKVLLQNLLLFWLITCNPECNMWNNLLAQFKLDFDFEILLDVK